MHDFSDKITTQYLEDIVFDPKHKLLLENRLVNSLLSSKLLLGYGLSNELYVVEKDPDFIPTYQKRVQPTLEKILGEEVPLPEVVINKSPLIRTLHMFSNFYYGLLFGTYAFAVSNAIDAYSNFLKGNYSFAAVSCALSFGFATGSAKLFNTFCEALISSTPYYKFDTEKIAMLTFGSKEDTLLGLAHEHVHHYQNLKNWPINNILLEGYACMISNQCAMDLSQNYKSPDWLIHTQLREVMELMPIVNPKQPYLKIDVPDGQEIMGFKNPTPHGKGIALFRILEHYHGNKLYDEFRNGNFDILQVPKERK